jgi:hypothetical protein
MGIVEVNVCCSALLTRLEAASPWQPISRTHIATAAESAMTDNADDSLRTLRLCDSALES